MDWGNVPSWVQVVLVCSCGLIGWAYKLQLANARLESRVKVLEEFRSDDIKAIKQVGEVQNQILIKLEGVLTRLELTHPTARPTRRKRVTE